MVFLRRAVVGLAVLSAFGTAYGDFDGPAPVAWRWADRIEQVPSGSPVVSGDMVYAAVGNRMYCLERETGNQVWRFPSGEPLQASFTTGCAVSGDIMVAAADDKAVYGINTRTGEMVWQYVAPTSVFTAPVIAGNAVAFGMSNNQIMAVDLRTGQAIWDEPYSPNGTVYNNMVGWQGNVMFLTSDGNLTALDIAAKRPLWRPRQFTSVSPLSGLSVFGDTIVVTSGSYVTSLTAGSGRVRWEQLVPGVLMYGAAVGPDGVVVVTSDGRMHSFSNAGRPAFRNGIDLNSTPVAAPSFAGRLAAIPTANGSLNLLDPFSGQVVWNFTIPPIVKGLKVDAPSGGTGGGGLGGPGLGGAGGGGQAGGGDQIEVKSVSAAGSAVTAGDTLVLLAQDGSILAFDKNLGVDLTAPAVTMGWPNAGDQVSGRAPMELVFLVSDEGSGVNYDSVTVTINGQEYVHEVDRDGRLRIRILQASSTNRPLANGRAKITVTMADWMGNSSATNFTLTIDNTLPALGSPRTDDGNTGAGGTGAGRGGRGGAGGGGIGGG